MYFKRLEMQGFKSFADPMIIDFHEGVTCIVGPNGSGKSNVSDALRWVLGEQSPKALRGGRMEEVIFNGTEARRAKGMAEVTLVIDNSAGILKIDYSEVAITRRMYRNGDSEYLINNNQCRLKDIRELIMDTGIGVDGYSIIGQGKIQDIVSNKPEARRSIFEESAGIVAYKTRKTEAEHKLERTRQNLDRINDIVSEIEGRIDTLKEDSEKAKKYLEMRDRFKELEVNITLRNIDNADKRSLQYQQDEKDIQEKIDAAKEGKTSIDEESSRLESQRTELDAKAEDAHNRMLETVQTINDRKQENQHSEERVVSIQAESHRLATEIEQLTRKREISEAELQSLRTDHEEAVSKDALAKENLREKTEEYDRIASDTSGFNKIIDEGNDRLFRLHSEAAAKKSEARSLENYRDTLENRQKEIEKEREQLKSQLGSEDERRKSAGSELERAEEEKKRIEKILSDGAKRKSDLGSSSARLRTQREELKITENRLSARLHTIEEMEHNYEGYNYPVKFIMQSGLSGIHGVVAEMLDVPARFETAVETALGAAKQNIIVSDDASAKRAVALLKENRAGRLTFLPAASIQGTYTEPDQALKSDPAFLGIASDLVGFDSKYQDVVDYLLGRTAVVEKLDDAIRLSKKVRRSGLRFVTTDGEVINPQGAITGGKYKGENSNLIGRRNEMERLRKEIGAAGKDLEKIEKELAASEKELDELTRQIAEAEKERYDNDVRLSGLMKDAGSIDTGIEEIRDRIEKAENEAGEIVHELERNSRMSEDLIRESGDAEEEIKTVSAEIEKAMSGYESRQRQSEEASKALTEARIEANKWAGKLSSITAILERVEKEEKEYSLDIKNKQDQIYILEEEKERLVAGKENFAGEQEALEKQKAGIERELKKLNKDRESISERSAAIAGELKSREDEINGLRDEKYQLEIRAAKNEALLEQLKNKLWDDFEISYAEAQDLRWETFAMGKAQAESKEMREGIRELGDVNIGAIEEYEQVSKRYRFLTEQREDVTTAMNELTGIINDMDTTIRKKFRENFDKVEENFETVFSELFGGGHAELRIEEGQDLLDAGIDIIAQPPGKRLQNINLLSGGEKTMTAIALMFAVLKVKPTPFCILDEVEAALDDANIDRFADYLKNFANTQFAIITHQKATMEHADVLYGITMPEHGVSRLLSLRLGDYDPDDYTE
ncbi:MAG: chromosome segregation protein SMC [Eubacterium sp.]|nr:chromosome segregation protein SMC [Eubacterium sp.]